MEIYFDISYWRMNPCKTTEGKYKFSQNKSVKFTSSNYKKIINDLIITEHTEDELCSILEKMHNDNDNKYFKIYHNWEGQYFYKYIIDRSYFKVFDILVTNSKYYNDEIRYSICFNTDDVHLYKKYVTHDTNPIRDLFLSFMFKGNPSELTEYIVDNYDLKIKYSGDMCIYLNLIYISDCDKLYQAMKYAITRCKLAYNNICYRLCTLLKTDECIEILELLFDNFLPNDIYEYVLDIMHNQHIDVFKYFFIKYYDGSDDTVIKFLVNTIQLENIQYLVGMIDRDKIFAKYFEDCSDYKTIKWLYDENLLFDKIEDKIIPYHPNLKLISDSECMIMILEKITDSYVFLKNTRTVMKKIIEFNICYYLIETVPINMFNLAIVFEIASLNEQYDLMNMLVTENYKPINIDDVVSDLNILEKYSMLEYIDKNFGI